MKRRMQITLIVFLTLVLLVSTSTACNYRLILDESPEPGEAPPSEQQPPLPPGEEPAPPEDAPPPPGEPPPVEEPPPSEGEPPPVEPPIPEKPQADLAVTDIYPDNLPMGKLFVRITNNGPTTLMTYPVILVCHAFGRQWANQSPPDEHEMRQEYVIQVASGQTETVETTIQIDANLYEYETTCEVQADLDPNPANNSYTEVIPNP